MLKAKFHPQEGNSSTAAGQEYGGGEPISVASVPGMTTLRNMSSAHTIVSVKIDGMQA